MRGMEPFVLATDRVRLSVPTERDVDVVAEICTDPAIAEWTTVPSPYTRADAEGFVTGMVVDGWATGTSFTWAVRDPGDTDGPVLGMVGMTCEGAEGVERVGELGYWAAPAARGRGLTTEAARLVVDWALDPEGLGLVRAHWSAYVGNWASRRVAWKLGFRFEGTLRRWALQRGARRDAWVGSLLPEDPREPSEPWPAAAAG
ncbi:RimJ/RimL family protein N-acetyltransferase [Isoptericola variabilis J7]|uniref:GCN5-related N-acetyltransferase n=2 Tax=Isoptericola TaxID=254250 RepID=F6FTR3_ISOV2|nr:GCN5-related N-acetyltransferase [Isoptericola variabilis 225]TWH28493.1 RimJ/RimL family protein N-acetyltransferase [Isoptericola variabilis J7]